MKKIGIFIFFGGGDFDIVIVSWEKSAARRGGTTSRQLDTCI